MEGITICDIDIEAGDDGQSFSRSGSREAGRFWVACGYKKMVFYKTSGMPSCRIKDLVRYLRVVDKGFTLNSHVGNTGSNPVGTTNVFAYLAPLAESVSCA
jgi:hypothetical protein